MAIKNAVPWAVVMLKQERTTLALFVLNSSALLPASCAGWQPFQANLEPHCHEPAITSHPHKAR